ncbi:MAG: cupin-like domain-containing protein [Chloroflexi bacterium]|nr:cupin-like domain-containing protein [Chloroflexota bacterium]
MATSPQPTPIPRVSREVFEREYLPANKPAIIQNSLSDWRAVGLWTHDYLAATYRDKRVVVSASIAETLQGESPAVESGFWIKHVDEEMDFPAAIELITRAKQTNRHYYLYRRSVPDEYPELYPDISIPAWIPVAKPRINLWVGGAHHVTTLHYDLENNFFAQVHGHKHFTIFSPEETAYLYPHPVHSAHANISTVDVDKPDLGSFPDFASAQPIAGIVGPGDLLYLPSRWWHHVRSLDDSISVNFWWQADFAQTLAPNELRHLQLQYQLDRLQGIKATALDPAGISFLDLAGLLFERRYYLPAIVAAGAALDEALRQLCRQQHIPDRHTTTLRDLLSLNTELEALGVYGAEDAWRVRGWNDMIAQALAADNRHFQAVDDRLFAPQAVRTLIDEIAEFCRQSAQAETQAPDDLEFDILL